MCRGVLLFAVAAAVAALVAPASAAAQSGNVRAGVASVDASWHVGASAGQYASDGTLVDHDDGIFDPTAHSVRRKSSHGIQSRLSVRALVVEGPDGERVAILKNDLYIPQDLVYRRAGQLLEEEGECGITPESLTMAVTHNHSSPFYSSTSWGEWTFQDVFDVRFFNYMAERMFAAVERACDELVPVRVGASVNEFDKTHRHSFGPAIADDGTPAGYPRGDTDHDLTVIRFDDISDPGHPRPLANLVNFSLHPEFLEGNDLISADYLGPLERMVDRETGAITVFTQGAVGTSEPERSEWHSVHERLEFSHRDYAQSELGARLMADSIAEAWRDVARGTPHDPDRSSDSMPTSRWRWRTGGTRGRSLTPTPASPRVGRTRRSMALPGCRSWGCPIARRWRSVSTSWANPLACPNPPRSSPARTRV
jgi:Neutral/alkaline non-lysosomal ceramidase, N-terminal